VKNLPIIRVVVLLAFVAPGINFSAFPLKAQIPDVGPGKCVDENCSFPSDSGGGAGLVPLIQQALAQVLAGFSAKPIQPPLRLARPPEGRETFHPTFNCLRTTAAAEDVVCGDEILSRLDRQLGVEYVRLLRKLDRRRLEDLVYEERDWLHERDLCQYDRTCIFDRYNDRIDHFRSRSAELERGCGASQWCCRHDLFSSQCSLPGGCPCTACCPK